MLKKIILSSGLMALSLTAGAESTNVGFPYVGVSLGGANFSHTVTLNDDQGISPTLGQVGFSAGLLAGFEMPLGNNFSLGLEAFGNDTWEKDTLTINGRIQGEYRNNYGVRALPTMQITQDTSVHVIAGFARANVRFENNGLSSAIANTTFNTRGYQAGVGSATTFIPNLSLRGDITYTGYTNHMVRSASGPIVYRNHNMISFDALVSLVYKFALNTI